MNGFEYALYDREKSARELSNEKLAAILKTGVYTAEERDEIENRLRGV